MPWPVDTAREYRTIQTPHESAFRQSAAASPTLSVCGRLGRSSVSQIRCHESVAHQLAQGKGWFRVGSGPNDADTRRLVAECGVAGEVCPVTRSSNSSTPAKRLKLVDPNFVWLPTNTFRRATHITCRLRSETAASGVVLRRVMPAD